jgi:hypothetical protein
MICSNIRNCHAVSEGICYSGSLRTSSANMTGQKLDKLWGDNLQSKTRRQRYT